MILFLVFQGIRNYVRFDFTVSTVDDMKPSDVGLENLAAASKNGLRSLRNGASFRSPPITYLELYECDSFSVGLLTGYGPTLLSA